eukprot:m.565481 g.565481  ORF g.565481 m.565481 type:complete len:519 (+) comp22243_c0_seq5:313-1869(+)
MESDFQGDEHRQHAVVIGAGVVGVCTAYALALRGIRVTVVESASEEACGCSFANAGRFCPTRLVATTTQPAKSFRESFDSLFPSGFGNYTFTDRLKFVHWGLFFMRYSDDSTFRRQRAMQNLARRAILSTENTMIAAGITGPDIDRKEGNLWVYSDKECMLADSLPKHVFAAQIGVRAPELMSRAESTLRFPNSMTRGIETGAFVGCTYVPDDWTADARKFTAAIRAAAEKTGLVNFMFNTTVLRVYSSRANSTEVLVRQGTTRYGRPITVEPPEPTEPTSQAPEVLSTDTVVICGGLASTALVNSMQLPIIPMRGCSVEIDGITSGMPEVAMSMEGSSNFLQATPLSESRMRLTGYAEFTPLPSSMDLAPETLCATDATEQQDVTCSFVTRAPKHASTHDATTDRHNTLLKGAMRVLPLQQGTLAGESNTSGFVVSNVWTGYRPMTPDMLPIVGRIRSERGKVYVNAGHGTMGWTLAAATADMIADDVASNGETPVCKDLAPERFELHRLLFPFRTS